MTLLKILLIVATLLQIVATVMAVRLIKATKYNVIWILFIVALTAMTLTRILTYISLSFIKAHIIEQTPYAFYTIIWLEVLASFCITIGMFYARKLINYIDNINFQKHLTSKRILSTVLRTEEKERIRFSKELHDGLGPLISSAKMSLSALSKSEGIPPADRETIVGTCHVIEEATRSIREISNNLSPHVLKEFGLARGINNFVRGVQNMHKVQIDFDTDLHSKRYSTDIEVILYRIICELTNNSLKHSACDKISISLRQEGDTMTLLYSDDGCGFNPSAASGSGMGLSNISSRVSSIGGTLELKSEKGAGMSAKIVIYLKQEKR